MHSVPLAEQLLKVAEFSPGIKATFAEDGKIYWMNRLGQVIFGIDLDNREIADINITQLFTEGSAEIIKNAIRSLKDEGFWEAQCQLKTAAKPVRPSIAYIQPIFKSDQELDFYYIFIKEVEGPFKDIFFSEEKYQKLVNNAQIGIFRTTINDGTFLDANDRVWRFLGFGSRDELISSSSLPLYDSPQERDRFMASFQDGMLENFETKFTGKNKAVSWINMTARIYPDLGYIEGFMTDITVQKNVENALRESEQQLQNIINFLPDATFVINNDRIITSWNKAAEELLGYKASDMVGKGNYEYALPFYGIRRPILIDMVITDGTDRSDDYPEIKYLNNTIMGENYCPAVGPSGSILWAIAAPLYDTLGYRIGAIESIRDITERRQAEEAVKDSEEKLRSITSSANDAIITIDSQGKISFWNRAAVYIFGYTEEEMLGQDMHSLIAPSVDHKDYLDFLDRLTTTGQFDISHKPLQLISQHKDGHKFPIELTMASFKINNLWFVTGIARDITDRKRFETELLQAREAAEAANNAKSQFLANVSHEIRTPLTAIIGMTQLLIETPLSSTQKDWAVSALDSSFHLLSIINQILDFSKMEAGKFTISEVPVDLSDILKRVINLESSKAVQKNLKLISLMDSRIPEMLLGDPLRITQILLNLTDNAIKFTDQGRITIQAYIETSIGSLVYIRFEISDTGIGIAETDQDKIFFPFTQVDNSTTRSFGGTGLGLVICRNLVSLMGGTIGFSSEKGKGSTFWFIIPFKQDVVLEQSIEEETPQKTDLSHLVSQSPTLPYSSRFNYRVLLVEDDPVCSKVVNLQLGKLGIEVDVACNGEEAVKASSSKDYSLIFMDCHMPIMDGFAATRAIREAELGSEQHVPIIAMTARALEEDRDLCAQAGMDDYLSKPVDFNQLFTTLKKWLA